MSHSAAMSLDMVPMMIQQGYRAIAVAFDMWGFANLCHGSLEKAKAFARQTGEANGTANGMANGEAPSS